MLFSNIFVRTYFAKCAHLNYYYRKRAINQNNNIEQKKKRTLKAEFKKYKVNERSEWNGKHNTNIS